VALLQESSGADREFERELLSMFIDANGQHVANLKLSLETGRKKVVWPALRVASLNNF
jgi:hypothetical protein